MRVKTFNPESRETFYGLIRIRDSRRFDENLQFSVLPPGAVPPARAV